MRKLGLAAIVLCIFVAAECAAAEDESVALTVYNDGNAIVRQRRTIEIPPDGRLRFPEVAATIDPTTVKFRSITDPDGTTVIEQNYEYDLVSADKLLQKYIDREIEVIAGAELDALKNQQGEGEVFESRLPTPLASYLLDRAPESRDIRSRIGL